MAEIMIRGIVRGRNTRKVPSGETRFDLEIEEPGTYQSVFRMTSNTSEVFGPKDGFAAVGKEVVARGFINGKVRTFTTKSGTQANSYDTWIKLTSLEPVEPATAPSTDPSESIEAASTEDYPF